jgi:hypothetical protein
LRYHPGSPAGEMRVELRPSASDVQMRKDIRRETGEDSLTLAWDAVAPGRYEVTLSRSRKPIASLGHIDVAGTDSIAALDIYGTAEVSVRVLGSDPEQATVVRIVDQQGRVVAAKNQKPGVFESHFADVPVGVYHVLATSGQLCSPPKVAIFGAGAREAVELHVGPCGRLVFAADSEPSFNVMLRSATLGSFPLTSVSGSSLLLPTGEWVLEAMS